MIHNLSYIFTPGSNELDFSLDLYVSNADVALRYIEDDSAQYVSTMWMNFGRIEYGDPDICTKQNQETAEPPKKRAAKSRKARQQNPRRRVVT